jgi:hypothetical protein
VTPALPTRKRHCLMSLRLETSASCHTRVKVNIKKRDRHVEKTLRPACQIKLQGTYLTNKRLTDAVAARKDLAQNNCSLPSLPGTDLDDQDRMTFWIRGTLTPYRNVF